MRTLESWFSEYAESHQNKMNILIHMFAVPVIMFSTLGVFWCVPLYGVWNLAHLVVIAALAFYFRLSIRYGLAMAFVASGMLYLLAILEHAEIPMLAVSVGVFVIAWIFQFVGHRIEGKKPSFFKDLQFLLIGPIWVLGHFLPKK